MYIMVKIVKGNKYYWNSDSATWEGLKSNATKLTDEQCTALKAHFPVDTYFLKVK